MSEWFGDPEAMWLVLVPAALAVIAFLLERRRRALVDQFVSRTLVPLVVRGLSPARRRWKHVLVVVAALLIAVGAMRPQWGAREVEVVRRGIDLVFVVDTSRSMLAEDVEPNRIERVKADIRYFVGSVVQQDRLALVAFAGTARTLCPLTLDRGAFEIFLDDLDVGIIPRGGTDLGVALDEALAAFGDDVRNHKAIVLFSDGEAHDGVPEESLEAARRRGVRIYTIGIGSSDGVRIPIHGPDGGTTFLKDSDGSIVLTRLDDRTLKTIAQRSLDGAYMHLSSGRKNLEAIYLDNIKKIEERELGSRRRERRVDRFQLFLGAALALLMIESMLASGVRRKEA